MKRISPFVLVKLTGFGYAQNQIPLSVLPVVCLWAPFCARQKAGDWGLSRQPPHAQS